MNVRTFIDIGAYAGEYIRFARSLFPDADVFAFEPLRAEALRLTSDFAGEKSIRIFNLAIGERETPSIINRSSYAPSSSLLAMASLHKEAFPHTSGSKPESVDIKRLDTVLQGYDLRSNIFVKVDVQGYEDRVIAGAQSTLQRTKLVLIEVSFETLYDGQVLFDNVYQQLRELGLEFAGVKNQVLRPSNGAILQAHAYFVRRDS